MNFSKDIYIIIQEAISLNKAEIVEDNESYSLIDDKVAGIYYICINSLDLDVFSLILQGKQKENTIAVVSELELDLGPIKEFEHALKVKQFVYKGDKFNVDSKYPILPFSINDLSYLKAHYYRIGNDDEYFMSAIARGMLKAVNEKGEIIGFIGEHPEHALGMLYIDEVYRRQGIGRALEQALINKFIDEGKIPFDHVVITNDKSIHLQNSLGMTISEGNIYWYF